MNACGKNERRVQPTENMKPRDLKEKLTDEGQELELKAKAKGKEVSNDMKDSAEKAQSKIKQTFGQ